MSEIMSDKEDQVLMQHVEEEEVMEEKFISRASSSSSNRSGHSSHSVSAHDNHPLLESATSSIVVQEEKTTVFVEDEALLDDQDRLDINPTTTLPTLDPDTSHAKGFYNVADSRDVVDLQVQGQLPEWLVGEHYTIGPGVYDIKYTRKVEMDGILQSATYTFTLGHWFDALPLVNRFDINGERNIITYRHQLTTKRLIEKIRDHHGYAPSFPAGLFKTNPNQTMLIKFLNNGKKPKPDRVPCGQRITWQVPGLEGRLFCQDFANHVQELDPFDLSPSRITTWDEINPEFKGYSSCPHGQYDVETGEYINFTMEIGYRSTKYHFFLVTESEPKGHIITTIWDAPTGWVNNFCLTSNYIIMVIHPMLANTGAVKFAWSESILDSFNFYPSEPTLFYVISRQEKQVMACYRSTASFSLNPINAFEDVHGNIVLDIICYQDDHITQQLSTDNLRHPETMEDPLVPSQVRRYTLAHPQHEAHTVYLANNSFIPSAVNITSRIGSLFNLVTGSVNNPVGASGWHAWMPVVEYDILVQEVSLELPVINPLYKMKQHTYVYGLGFATATVTDGGKVWDSIIKMDVVQHAVLASWHEEGCYPSEAQFIPKPGNNGKEGEEDEGVLLSIVLDSARSTSFLICLDAKNLQVLARIELNKLIPLSFARGTYRPRLGSIV